MYLNKPTTPNHHHGLPTHTHYYHRTQVTPQDFELCTALKASNDLSPAVRPGKACELFPEFLASWVCKHCTRVQDCKLLQRSDCMCFGSLITVL
jgi:hypothetical protein